MQKKKNPYSQNMHEKQILTHKICMKKRILTHRICMEKESQLTEYAWKTNPNSQNMHEKLS